MIDYIELYKQKQATTKHSGKWYKVTGHYKDMPVDNDYAWSWVTSIEAKSEAEAISKWEAMLKDGKGRTFNLDISDMDVFRITRFTKADHIAVGK